MTDIEPWENDAPAPYVPRIDLKAWAEEFRDVYRIAEALCKTPFVPREMIGHQADVAAAIMKGRELGLNPFDALGSIYIVHGRVGFYAEFMRRRIIQAGHIFKIIETTDNRCIVEGVRKDSGQSHRASFTLEQARKAGIDLGKYPAEKLIARATSRLCKQAFPDVLSGSLIAEDLIDGLIPADADQAAPPAEPGPPIQRKRSTRPAKAARTQPKPTKPTTPAEPDDDIAELLGDNPATNLRMHPDLSVTDTSGTVIAPSPDDILAETHEPDEPITKPQKAKLHALFRQLGITNQTDRHTIRDHILGFHNEGLIKLTKPEANLLIDTTENWLLDTDYPPDDRIRDILNTKALQQAETEEQDGG